jgi:signal transduction histidine kinase
VPRDALAAFGPAILAIRWATTAVGVALASPQLVEGQTAAWVVALGLLAYSAFRTARPLRYVDDARSLLVLLAEVTLTIAAVTATGYWGSHFAFSALTAVALAGFARGFAFGLRLATASLLAVSIPWAFEPVWGAYEVRVSVQWSVILLLVALVAGYARRISGEADIQQSLALDRLGRLADANQLLFALHQVAQTLPASFDLDEALDSTVEQLAQLFDHSSIALLVLDETDGLWHLARRVGAGLPPKLPTAELPDPLARALRVQAVLTETNLAAGGGGGLAPRAASGLYAVLPARGHTIGLVAVEHEDTGVYGPRDLELLGGFVEAAALAIDNARWFARLRTVGADEERTRIARDLHDRIGQSLAYLAFELDRITKGRRLARDEPTVAALEQLRGDVRGVIAEVRDTLYDLRTDVSQTRTVAETLDEFLARVGARSGLLTRLRAQETARLPILQERELWRIAQEAIVNVERHAQAGVLTVTWRCDGRRASLEVADDGRGLPAGGAGRLDSYGIIGMRERAAGIGATLELSSEPGKGTRVRCTLDTR